MVTKQIYLGGVMQGSHVDDKFDSQSYRDDAKKLLVAKYPDIKIYCPFTDFAMPVHQTKDDIFTSLEFLLEQVRKSNLFIGYFPVASNGTALELYNAFQNKIPTIVITDLSKNWVIKSYANHILPSLEAFSQWVESGGLDEYLA